MIRAYAEVVGALGAMNLVCHYHNSGAFGFPRGSPTLFRGWIGPEDATIRPAVRDCVRQSPPPWEPCLARLARSVWLTLGDGPAWLMPLSHWAFELEHGSRDWLPSELAAVGIDPAPLATLNNASAIEVSPDEPDILRRLVECLLCRLTVSDFALLLPPTPLVCTIHHHKQLWWVCRSPEMLQRLDQLFDGAGPITPDSSFPEIPLKSGPAASN